jgi:hypothetical protein
MEHVSSPNPDPKTGAAPTDLTANTPNSPPPDTSALATGSHSALNHSTPNPQEHALPNNSGTLQSSSSHLHSSASPQLQRVEQAPSTAAANRVSADKIVHQSMSAQPLQMDPSHVPLPGTSSSSHSPLQRSLPSHRQSLEPSASATLRQSSTSHFPAQTQEHTHSLTSQQGTCGMAQFHIWMC